ncbi:hypothetical protein BV378_27710 [Nostoc sp. RF31YmG]|nr:hypothetical protein BV378_27710 [Nostoc sp. RF31YmG]
MPVEKFHFLPHPKTFYINSTTGCTFYQNSLKKAVDYLLQMSKFLRLENTFTGTQIGCMSLLTEPYSSISN